MRTLTVIKLIHILEVYQFRIFHNYVTVIHYRIHIFAVIKLIRN